MPKRTDKVICKKNFVDCNLEEVELNRIVFHTHLSLAKKLTNRYQNSALNGVSTANKQENATES